MVVITGLALLFHAAPALGQRPAAAQPAPRWFVGGSLNYASPQGDFGEQVDQGFGLAAHGMYKVDQAGWLGLRLDGGFIQYGSESYRVPLSGTIGGRIMVDVNTSNQIAHLGVGPQLGVPTGAFRPYVGGTVGLSYFATTSSVKGDDSSETFASDTNYDDLTLAFGGLGGVYIPLSRGATPVSLDLGARYHRNGEVSYLKEGSITDNVDGTVSFSPIHSEADILTFHIGVSIGISARAGGGGR
jgi:hypothetical protein